MRFYSLFLAMVLVCLVAPNVHASLPYYNSDVGYTIWLPKSWFEANNNYLAWAQKAQKPVPIQGDSPQWKAGYFSPMDGHARSLLVEVKHGRRMNTADISNFNRFVVRNLKRMSDQESIAQGFDQISLKSANYFKDKKILRLETEMVKKTRTILSLTYIVYTRIGILTFVGYVDPSDVQAKLTIDKAVMSLYLDDNVRYESR